MKKFTLALAALALLGPVSARPHHPKWPPQDYALCYGPWTEEMAARAHKFDLVVVHPGDQFDNLTPQLVQKIRYGADAKAATEDDVIVLAYVTVGEDDRPPAGPPPAVPERGPVSFQNKQWVQGKAGYPTRFFDQVSYVFEAHGERRYGEDGKPLTRPGQDGIPDENGVWGSYYVNAGDAEWQEHVLGRMKKLQEEFQVDGFFLDTLDTASPWGNYSFSQAQMAQMLKRIRKTYPDQLILANRGMFLLESHPQDYAPNLDGVLYESLYSIWDWGAKKGVISPWVKGDYAYLKNPVLPASQKKPGFHMFYVNYLDPSQSDFYPLMHAIEDLLGRKGVSNYVSDPLLQSLGSPLCEIFPEQGEAPPALSGLAASQQPLGRFQLRYEIPEASQNLLGKDLFLDVRLGPEGQSPEEIPLLAQVAVDYARPGQVDGVGLEKASSYCLYVRLVGKSRACRTAFTAVPLTTADGPQPSQVSELSARSLESSVELSWKALPTAVRYRIYQGSSPDRLQKIAETQLLKYRVQGLKNLEPTHFSVTAVDSEGREGGLCWPIPGRAEDCTPPKAPEKLQFESLGSEVSLSWTPSSDASAYKVYCTGQGEKYRIPVRIEADKNRHTLGKLSPGKYQVWVTAVDGSGNESPRNQVVLIEVK